MKRFLYTIRDYICYCGLSKEEYRSVKKRAYVSNFRVWKWLHLLMAISFAILTVFSIFVAGFDASAWLRLTMCIYSLVIFLLFSYVFTPESLGAQFIIYLSMNLLLVLGAWLGVARPEMMAVTFEVFLILIAMFMIDKPYFMLIELVAAAGIYILWAKQVKTGIVLRDDIVNTVCFCVLGIFINIFYNAVRIQAFQLQQRSEEHLLEEQQSNQKLRELYSVLSSVTKEYETFLLMDFDTGMEEYFHDESAITQWIVSQLETFSFQHRIERFAEYFVVPEDREEYISRMSMDVIRNGLRENGVYTHRFRSVAEDGVHWLETRAVPHDAGNGHECAIIALRLIDAEVQEEQARQAEIQNREMLEIIYGLAGDFESIVYLQLGDSWETDKCIQYRASPHLVKIMPNWTDPLTFRQRLKMLSDHFVLGADRTAFLAQTQRDMLLQMLQKEPAYFVNFRAVIEEELHYYQIKLSAVFNAAGNMVGVVAGLKNTDEITQEQKAREEELAEANERAERTIIRRTAELSEKNRQLAKTTDETVELLGDMVEMRDKESGTHIMRVKTFSYLLAKQVKEELPEYGLTDRDVRAITSASALHDVGKIMIPDAILLKPGRLTPEEFDIMKTHSAKGCEVLSHAPKNWNPAYLKTCMDICRHHHEKWDGHGYPDGLVGDAIPISAQIVSIADCYDALTTKRVYKDAFTAEEAYNMILRGDCGAFSDRLLSCFVHCREAFEHTEFSEAEASEVTTSVYETNKLGGLRLLLVDDDILSLEINEEILSCEGAQVTAASSGGEALAILRNGGSFNAIIMDLVMPGMDGFETSRLIRLLGNGSTGRVPIIALTAEESYRVTDAMAEAGIDAVMTKPLIVGELTRILLSFMKERSESLERKLEDTVKLANTDTLTHVKNIAAYTNKVSDLSEAMKVGNPPEFAVVMCDINYLKRVNDNYGHDVGDQYIKNCCKIICNIFTHSPVYRIGGDEFVSILQGTDFENREYLMQALREAVAVAEKKSSFNDGKASLAAGIAVYDPIEDFSVGEVIKHADSEMYINKRLMKA